MAVYINRLNGGNITIGADSGGGGSTSHTDTRFTLQGGTVESYEITGTLDRQWMVDNGYYNGNEYMWLKTITEADIGNTVTNIGNALSGCENLTSVTIPASVTNIEGGAFGGTWELTNVTFIGRTMEQVQAMDNYYEWGIDEGTIHVA